METINFKRSGGDMDVRMRVLQTYTLHTHKSGTIYVSDDRTGNNVGYGYASVEAAVEWFKRFDDARTALY